MLDAAYAVIGFPERGISLRQDGVSSRLPMTDRFQAAAAAKLAAASSKSDRVLRDSTSSIVRAIS
jgi:hypothetical protein